MIGYVKADSKMGDKNRTAKCPICWDGVELEKLKDEITALRKIAEAANDVGYSWSLANYPHPTVAKPMYILNEALKEWREGKGGDDD